MPLHTAVKPKIDRSFSCLRCRMITGLCLCPVTPCLDLNTKIVVFMHWKEYPLISNTGVLAHRTLKNSQIVFRGHPNRIVTQRDDFLKGRNEEETFILFPSENASELNEDFLRKRSGPLTLICPDGRWGPAKKIPWHEPSLKNLSFVKLPPGEISQYRLRRNIIPGNVCTFEAITCALGIIEGPQVQKEMESIFNKMVTRLLWTRGRIPLDQLDW